MVQRYLIALGSNRRHQRHGSPERVLPAALAALAAEGIAVVAAAPILHSAPLGPSRRRYANSAALIETRLSPPDLLDQLKRIEAAFGRRSGGQRWTSRVLDLDVVLWSGGIWADPDLTVPHRAFRQRDFVLRPALALAPAWRDPITTLSLRQLHARLTRPRPIPR
jgi:2-amino-4-hydroxy-6-hydroxymethyldihydropteridine diphosphokinase